ncbi:hypothetical protein [Clostridium minihomine]|uniref:hypothetical protein n=1 Tax=Clostridium minihomine TaxID=2045012 RepID=UPI000C77AAA7|nr:hypothetical protein [Clostridium minihomine]
MKIKRMLGLPCKGGKNDLLVFLLPLIKYLALESPKRAFLDVCGGGGKLACNVATKFLYDKVLYNEYERGMAALMACLTDEARTRKVVQLVDRLVQLCLSHDPKDVFNHAKSQRDQPGLDLTLAAAYTFYCIYASYANNRTTYNENKAIQYFQDQSMQKGLLKYPTRIQRMLVTCGSCFDVLERYIDYDDITSFIDPPYYDTKTYKNDWSLEDYERLNDILSKTKNKIILCGREEDRLVYDGMLAKGWTRTSLGYISKSSDSKGELVEEFIWTNFAVPSFITDLVNERSIRRAQKREESAKEDLLSDKSA